jgi:hypothetical protein
MRLEFRFAIGHELPRAIIFAWGIGYRAAGGVPSRPPVIARESGF